MENKKTKIKKREDSKMNIIKKTVYVNEEGFKFKFEPITDSVKITKTKEGYEARYIISDENSESPRQWDNIGNMVCFHRSYTLGDNHNLRHEDFNGWDEMEEFIKKEYDTVIILPLYLYDHSGISIAVRPHGYHGSWDCGQVGFIYATKEDLKKEGMTKEEVEKHLLGEVETYNQYLTGDVYCIVKEDYNEEKEPIDYNIVGGYYGEEYAEKELLTAI
jgi:hypothetical protein